jgi:hypothetical protein
MLVMLEAENLILSPIDAVSHGPISPEVFDHVFAYSTSRTLGCLWNAALFFFPSVEESPPFSSLHRAVEALLLLLQLLAAVVRMPFWKNSFSSPHETSGPSSIYLLSREGT